MHVVELCVMLKELLPFLQTHMKQQEASVQSLYATIQRQQVVLIILPHGILGLD